MIMVAIVVTPRMIVARIVRFDGGMRRKRWMVVRDVDAGCMNKLENLLIMDLFSNVLFAFRFALFVIFYNKILKMLFGSYFYFTILKSFNF